MFSPLLTYRQPVVRAPSRAGPVALIASGQAVGPVQSGRPCCSSASTTSAGAHTMLWFSGFVLVSSVTITLIFLHRSACRGFSHGRPSRVVHNAATRRSACRPTS